MARVVRGTLVSFDSSDWTALVLLEGSLAETEMPVLETVPAQLLAADDEVAVLLFDATDPNNGLILGPFGAAGLLSSFLQLAEIAEPDAPASGALRLFAHSTQSWPYFINDAEAVVPLGVATVNLPIGAATLSSATRVFVQTHHDAISFADAVAQSAYWSFKLPPGWAGRDLVVKCLWAPSSTNGGAVLWSTDLFAQIAGTTLSSTATEVRNVAPTANGTTDRPQATTLATIGLSAFSEGNALVLRITRAGANGLDTFTGAARLLAVELSVVG